MHIPVRAVVQFAPKGDLVRVKLSLPARGGGRRDAVRGMSRGSRSRLMQKVATLSKHARPLFVTLTYPQDYPHEFEAYKRHLHNFFRRLFRAFPSAGVLWKLEFQRRGAPHYHFFLWGVSLDDAVKFIPSAWCEVSTGGDSRQLAWHKGELGSGNRPCVEQIRDWRGVRSYASKYMGKGFDDDRLTGRAWGVRGSVPLSPVLSFHVDMRDVLQFKRQFYRWSGMSSSGRVGFWAFGYIADWLVMLDAMMQARAEENIPPNFPPQWWRSYPYQESEVF